MEFSSISFIWLFLPVILCFYYLLAFLPLPRIRLFIQNVILLFASLVFYCFGGISNLLLLLGLLLINFNGAIAMHRLSYDPKKSSQRKPIFIAIVITNLLILAFYKYFEGFLDLITVVSLWKNPASEIGMIGLPRFVMPLALSFVVFQLISYLADVYNKKIAAENSFINFALYITFFAQLVQGPIMRFSVLGSQIRNREHSIEKIASGIRRFVLGFAKKAILADRFAALANPVWQMEATQINCGEAWLGLIAYTLQIYFDFSAYSDMAVGIGSMFGFEITENFNNPYFALSIRDFWKRWHMSLSNWFKDYIYIPLGGSRLGLRRTCENLFIVFLITGIWHGSDSTFIFWGMLFAFVSILEHAFLGKLLDKNPFKIINWVYTIFVVMMGWVLFRAPDINYALNYYSALFNYSEAEDSIFSYFTPGSLMAIVIVLVMAVWVKYLKIKELSYKLKVVENIGIIALFIISIMLIVSESYQPSIYWAF